MTQDPNRRPTRRANPRPGESVETSLARITDAVDGLSEGMHDLRTYLREISTGMKETGIEMALMKKDINNMSKSLDDAHEKIRDIYEKRLKPLEDEAAKKKGEVRAISAGIGLLSAGGFNLLVYLIQHWPK